MIIDLHKSINGLQEIKYNNINDIKQLEEVLYHLRERYEKLSEIDDKRYVGVILEDIVESMKNIEETLHRLHEVREGIEKQIQLYHVYADVEL